METKERLKKIFAEVKKLIEETPILEKETVLKFLSEGHSLPSLNAEELKNLVSQRIP